MADAPRVFISYSHDSEEHADRVLALADALCDGGIDVILDRYVHPAPAEGWPHWMGCNLDAAKFVLMICTETYLRRVMGQEEPGKGTGVRWAGKLIYNRICYGKPAARGSSRSCFPAQNQSTSQSPFVGTTTTCSRPSTSGTRSIKALYRHLTDYPATPRPDLGSIKKLPPKPRPQPSPSPLPLRNAIGFDDIRDEAYRKTIETSIEARLRALSNTPVDDGIVKRTPIQWLLKKLGLPLEEDGSSETARAASALVQPNKEELLPLLIGMHAKLCNLRRKEDALVLGEVIDMITPLQIPPDLWRKIREQMTAGGTVIRGGAAGIVTAETVAARIDGLEEPGPGKLSRKTDGDLTSPHRMLPKTYHPGRRFLSNQGAARAVREGTLHARAPRDDPSTLSHGGSVARRVQYTQKDPRPLPLCAGDDASKTGRSGGLAPRAG